jgi:hypothetical protein
MSSSDVPDVLYGADGKAWYVKKPAVPDADNWVRVEKARLHFARDNAKAALSKQEAAQPVPPEREGTAEFWASVFPDGATNEDIKKELSDFYFMMGEVPKVYMAVTGGKLSKLNYHASTIIAEFEQYMSDRIDEAVKEALEDATPKDNDRD